jgi:conjugative relaxase-like TrwC/TraI family protein
MLSIQWITDVDYYLDQAKADYYFRPGEPPGRWWGAGAKRLSLGGLVNAKDLKELCNGFAPDGTALVQNAGVVWVRADGHNVKHQQAWDFTFSAPKSVSVYASQASRAVRLKIRKLHHKAVKIALQYLTDVALLTRRGKGGLIREHALPIAAIFEHGSSRELDPQLHSHCVLVNVAARMDGTWGTILSKPLYDHKLTAGTIYQIELAHLLRKVLGLRIVKEDVGFGVVGIPRELLDRHSTRSKQIRTRLGSKGFHTAKAAAAAALDTRRSKQLPPARAELLKRWQTTNLEFGFTDKDAERLLGRVKPLARMQDLTKEIRQGVEELLESESYFSEQRLIRNVALQVMGKGLPADHIVEKVQDYIATNADIVPIGVFHDEWQFTTREMLDMEQELFRQIKVAANESSHLVELMVVERLLDERLPLSSELTEDEFRRNTEQRAAVMTLATAPGSVAVLEGMAGTGKTYTLSVARQAWEKAGFDVTGMALSAVAARNLHAGSGIPSETLAMRLLQLDGRSGFARHHKRQLGRLLKGKSTHSYSGPQFKFHRKSIVIVDEAGMVGTRQLVELMKHVRSAGAKLILVGDRRQLQPVDAGGPFRFIADGSTKAELNHVVRQKVEPDDPSPQWHREVGKLIAAGQATEAIKLFAERGRFHRYKEIDQAMFAMVRNWSVAGIANPSDNILLAGTNAAVTQLNAQCQSARLGAGALGLDSIEVGGTRVHVNDIVLFTENSRLFGVSNGDRGTVLGFNLLRTSMAVQLEANLKTVIIPYRSYSNFQLGYAMTTHKAQGATVPSVHVLLGGPMQDLHLSYVQSTRAQESTRLYVDRRNAGPKLRGLLHQMQKNRPKRLATEIKGINESGSNGTSVVSTGSDMQKATRPPKPSRVKKPKQRKHASDAPAKPTKRQLSDAAYREKLAKLRQAAGREPISDTKNPPEIPVPTPSLSKKKSESIAATVPVAIPTPPKRTRKVKPREATVSSTSQASTKVPPEKAAVPQIVSPNPTVTRLPEPQPTIVRETPTPKPIPTQVTVPPPPALSHLKVTTTTDLKHLNYAVERYGKLPGGIVVEGQASCDRPIYSLDIDPHQPTQLFINGNLRFETRLTAEEVALLYDALLNTGKAGKDFGVLSQQEATGVPSDSIVGVTMMIADDFLGSIIYGYDSKLVLHRSPVQAYVNPFIEAAELVQDDDDELERQCFTYLYGVHPQGFMTISGTHFTISQAAVIAPVSTSVSLALGMLTASGKVTERLHWNPTRGHTASTYFPSEYAALCKLRDSFPAFVAPEPRVEKTVAYAEVVLLLRLVRNSGAKLSGQEHIRNCLATRRSVEIPRLNHTIRSGDFSDVVHLAADTLARNPAHNPWVTLMTEIVGFRYATLAGNAHWYKVLKRQIPQTIAFLRKNPNWREPGYAGDVLAQLIPEINTKIEGSSHDVLIERCISIALDDNRTDREKAVYLNEGLRMCDVPSLEHDLTTRCRRTEIVSLLDAAFNPVPELTSIRREHSASFRPFDCMNTIMWRRLLANVKQNERLDWLASPRLTSTQLIRGPSDLTCNMKARSPRSRLVSETRLSEQESDRLCRELYRYEATVDEFCDILQKETALTPSGALSRLLYSRTQNLAPDSFSTKYLHRQNPFFLSHELLDHEPDVELARLYGLVEESVDPLLLRDFGSSPEKPLQRLVRRAISLVNKPTPFLRWQDFLRIQARSPQSTVSKCGLLLAYELQIRGLTRRDVIFTMHQEQIANPQAALFWRDASSLWNGQSHLRPDTVSPITSF